MSRKIDLERLKRMTGANETDEPPASSSRRVSSRKAAAKAPAAKRRRRGADEDDDEEGEEDEDEEEERDEEEQDDDLVDSDDDRRTKKRPSRRAKKAAPKRSKKAKKAESDDDDDYQEEGAAAGGEEGEEGEEEDDDDGFTRRGRGREEEKEDTSGPADRDDMRKIIQRRTDIEAKLHEPFFKDWIVGQFVRFPKPDLGKVLDPGVKVYALSRVADVIDATNPYKLSSGRLTSKRLVVKTGAHSLTLKLCVVSDSATIPERSRELEDYNRFSAEVRSFKPLSKDQVGCVDAWMGGCVDAWMGGWVDACVSKNTRRGALFVPALLCLFSLSLSFSCCRLSFAPTPPCTHTNLSIYPHLHPPI